MKHVLVASALTVAILFGASGCAREAPSGEGDEAPEALTTTPVPPEEPADLAAEAGQDAPSNEAR